MTSSEAPAKPGPQINELNREFWEATRRSELRMQECTSCRHIWFPPSSVCPRCLSADFTWKPLSGRGKVWSFIRMWQRYFPGFAPDIPYVVAYIELDEGPRMMSTIVDCTYGDLVCDMPVEVVFGDAADGGVTLPMFRRARSDESTRSV